MLFTSSSSNKFIFVCWAGPQLPKFQSEGWCLILLPARDKSYSLFYGREYNLQIRVSVRKSVPYTHSREKGGGWQHISFIEAVCCFLVGLPLQSTRPY